MELNPTDFANVEGLYLQTGKDFPLIHAVIAGIQKGRIFADSRNTPTSAFVVHKFGFVQIVGKEDSLSFNSLVSEKLLAFPGLINREYVLWYHPHESIKRQIQLCNPANWRERERIRLIHPASDKVKQMPDDGCVPLSKDIVRQSEYLGVQIHNRFWESPEDFLSNGVGVAVIENGLPVSVCYAAALVDSKAEVDIVTAEAYRRKGLGSRALNAFLDIASRRGINSMWDCFETNTESLEMARKNRFVEKMRYEFVTFNTPIITHSEKE